MVSRTVRSAGPPDSAAAVPPASTTIPASGGDEVVQQARAGARLLTLRGMAMRAISVTFNLVLLAWVTPAELGLLAVVRALCFFVDFGTGQSVATGFIRTRDDPSRADYAALTGLQLTLLTIVLAIALFLPGPFLAATALGAEWRWPATFLIATMLVIPLGTGAKVRLERAFDYRALAPIEVATVLVQNVGLLIFALLGKFSVGLFIVYGVAHLFTSGWLLLASRGPAPSLDFARMWRLVRETRGFTATAWVGIAKDHVTPVIITHLFGLQTAGIWAFATRFGQLIQMGFEGFRRAAIPAAAKLRDDVTGLRNLGTHILTGAASTTVPLATAAAVCLPLVGLLWPQWAGSITMAQIYVLCFALTGTVSASLEPLAVARYGPSASLAEPALTTLTAWGGLLLAGRLGVMRLEGVVVAMYIAALVTLVVMTDARLRPRWSDELRRAALCLISGLAAYLALTAIHAPAIVTAALSCAAMAFWLQPMLRRAYGIVAPYLQRVGG